MPSRSVSNSNATGLSFCRCHIAALAGLIMLLALALGGCASNASRDWAQTAPVIPPSSVGQPPVHLGSVEQPS